MLDTKTTVSFDLSNFRATGTFVLFRQKPYENFVVMTAEGPLGSTTAVLDISGVVRFNGTSASISSASATLIFTDGFGKEIVVEALDDLHESPEMLERLSTIFGEDIVQSCVLDALRGTLA